MVRNYKRDYRRNNKAKYTKSSKPQYQLVEGYNGKKLYFPLSHRIPSSKNVILKWGRNFTLGDGVASAQTKQFRLNSIWDPDFTGTGTNPAYYHAYAEMYQKYTVFEAVAKIQYVNNGSVPINVASYVLADQATPVTDPEEVAQIPSAKVTTLSETGTGQLSDHWHNVNLPKVSGYENAPTDQLSARIDANPVAPIFLNVQASSLTGNTLNSNSIYAQITIFYKVQMFGNDKNTI